MRARKFRIDLEFEPLVEIRDALKRTPFSKHNLFWRKAQIAIAKALRRSEYKDAPARAVP